MNKFPYETPNQPPLVTHHSTNDDEEQVLLNPQDKMPSIVSNADRADLTWFEKYLPPMPVMFDDTQDMKPSDFGYTSNGHESEARDEWLLESIRVVTCPALRADSFIVKIAIIEAICFVATWFVHGLANYDAFAP